MDLSAAGHPGPRRGYGGRDPANYRAYSTTWQSAAQPKRLTSEDHHDDEDEHTKKASTERTNYRPKDSEN